MYKEITTRIKPEDYADLHVFKKCIAQCCGMDPLRIVHIDVLKRSIDARQKTIYLNIKAGVHIDEIHKTAPIFVPEYKNVADSRKSVIIVGAGPAGLFAALRLIEGGIRPILLERGKCVRERLSDLSKLYKERIVNPDSNFSFGEGGAGTFSDGKLYTRSKKRGDNRRILEILVYHGASPQILVDSHPHVGTDKLPKVIENIRNTILNCGGEIYFGHRVDSLLMKGKEIYGVRAAGKEFFADQVILATGHSARDTYRMLDRCGVTLERKDFAVGFRLEHPQHEIDVIQYHRAEGRGQYLPAAEYSLVTNIKGRGVYSFCMCPGGVVVPATTCHGEQVVNGMSASKRNSPWANSAIVTVVGKEELDHMGFHGLYAGMEFQEQLESKAWQEGRENLYAPAQRMPDFIKGKESVSLPRCSYKPGVTPSRIDFWFPDILSRRIRTALIEFDRRHKGFISENAAILGVESRTSSPLRIPRDGNSLCHIEIKGLYPCGEGAGYSGGIVSSAIDGEKCAENIFLM